jgi:hypothetical protein
MTMLLAKVVDELAAAQLALRLPDQQCADRVLPEDGIEEPAHLLLAPDERTLDVGEPEAAILIGIVQEADNLLEGVFGCLHGVLADADALTERPARPA